MINQLVFVARVDPEDIKIEDGGQAKIAMLCPEDIKGSDEGGMFLRLHSWCDDGNDHPEFDALIKPGKEYVIRIQQVE